MSAFGGSAFILTHTCQENGRESAGGLLEWGPICLGKRLEVLGLTTGSGSFLGSEEAVAVCLSCRRVGRWVDKDLERVG